MGSNNKYIANYVFGKVTGMSYNLKNLTCACENPKQWQIKNFSLYGFKFIKIVDNNNIICYTKGEIKDIWIENSFTLKEFWNVTKQCKKDYGILEVTE